MAEKLQRGGKWVNEDGTPTARFAQAIEDLIQDNLEMTTNAQLALTRPSVLTAVQAYDSPLSSEGGRGTVITQFMATDPAGAATYSVYVGTTAVDATKIISSRTAAANGDSPDSIINALIKSGESLFLEASAINTIVFNISGIEKR